MNTHKTQIPSVPEPVADEVAQGVATLRVLVHDLAQPLSVLAGTIDLLLFEIEPDSPIFPEVQRMSEQLQQIIDKIDAIRQVARQINARLER